MEQILPPGNESKRSGDDRQLRYNGELLRDCVEVGAVRFFLDQACAQIRKPLLLTGERLTGKTAALTAWTPVSGRKLQVNCAADEKYRYWPEIAHLFIRQINEIDETAGFPDFDAKAAVFARILRARQTEEETEERSFFYVTDAERESFREGFVSWLGGLHLRERVCLVVNDPELLSGDGPCMTWLPTVHSDSIQIVCSSSDAGILAHARALDWELREFPLLTDPDASRFLDRSLAARGIKISQTQRASVLRTPLLNRPGCVRAITDELQDCADEAEMTELTAAVGELRTTAELCTMIWERNFGKLTEDARPAARTAFQILACTSLGLRRSELQELVSGFAPAEPAQWAEILRLADRFGLSARETWRIDDPDLRNLVLGLPGDLTGIQAALAEFFRARIDERPGLSAARIRRSTEYAGAAVRHMVQACRWEALCEVLSDRRVLACLTRLDWETVRSAWMHLLVDSDVDVGEGLSALLRDLIEEDSPIEAIRFRILSLMADLERKEAAAASELAGIPAVSTFREPDRNRIEDRVEEIWDGFRDELRASPNAALCLRITDYLEQNAAELNSYETTRFLCLKCSCEMGLQRWEEAVRTADACYREALTAMSRYDQLRALQMRGECRCSAGRFEAAEADLEAAAALADEMGALREYLEVLNLRAVCRNALGDYDGAAALLRRCQRAWTRLGEVREAAAAGQGLSSSLFRKGDAEGALETVRGVYRDLRRLRTDDCIAEEISVLCSIGACCCELEKYEEAEQAYLLALDRARDDPEGQKLSGVYRGLIDLYQKRRFYSRAIRTYETFAEYLYEEKAYSELAEVVREGEDLMRKAKYDSRANSFDVHWRKIFAELPDGTAALDGEVLRPADLHEEDALRKALSEAEQAGDAASCGDLRAELAMLLEATDPAAAADCFRRAQRDYAAAGEKERAMDCRSDAIRLLLPEWGTAAAALELAEELDETAAGTVARWRALRLGNLPREQFRAVTADLLKPENRSEYLTEACLTDLCADLTSRCEADQLVRAFSAMEGSRFEQAFRERMEQTLIGGFRTESQALMQDPTAAGAEEKIRRAQKTVLLLEKLGSDRAAGAAASLGLLFEGRKDKAFTLYYHRKAVELFRKAGADRERSAEILNLAAALRSFGEAEQAADLLRAELKELEDKPLDLLRASVAGHLASLLTEIGAPAAEDEIRACFALEEAGLKAAGEEQELAISLLKQIKYGLKTGKTEDPAMLKQYNRVRELVFRNRFREYYDVIQRLEGIFEPGRNAEGEASPPAQATDPSAARELENFMQRMIRTEGSYQFAVQPEWAEDTVRAVCVLKDPLPLLDVKLLLTASPETPEELRTVFLLKLAADQEALLPHLQDYVDWWNSQDSYRLKLDKEEKLLSLAFLCNPQDPERLNRSFIRICKYWMADLTSISMLTMGVTDSAALREMKLSAVQSLADQ